MRLARWYLVLAALVLGVVAGALLVQGTQLVIAWLLLFIAAVFAVVGVRKPPHIVVALMLCLVD